MVQLTKSTSRLLSRVGNEDWATSDDYENPVQSQDDLVNGEPLSSSDSEEDANQRANIPQSRVTNPAKRMFPPVKESSRKSSRITESVETRKTSTQKNSSQDNGGSIQSLGNFGRDDVVFAESRWRKPLKNFHAVSQPVYSNKKLSKPGKKVPFLRRRNELIVRTRRISGSCKAQ
jgi:hypothetical protein